MSVKHKICYNITTRGGKKYWTRIGVATHRYVEVPLVSVAIVGGVARVNSGTDVRIPYSSILNREMGPAFVHSRSCDVTFSVRPKSTPLRE